MDYNENSLLILIIWLHRIYEIRRPKDLITTTVTVQVNRAMEMLQGSDSVQLNVVGEYLDVYYATYKMLHIHESHEVT